MSSSPVMVVAQRAWLAAVLILVYSWDVPGPGVKVIASMSSCPVRPPSRADTGTDYVLDSRASPDSPAERALGRYTQVP